MQKIFFSYLKGFEAFRLTSLAVYSFRIRVTRGERACRACKVFGAANPTRRSQSSRSHCRVCARRQCDLSAFHRKRPSNPGVWHKRPTKTRIRRQGIFLFLLSIFACRRAGRIDARCPRRIHAERNAHRHSRLQISNARSLTVHSDLSELCNRERPGRVLVAYSNRVTSYA